MAAWNKPKVRLEQVNRKAFFESVKQFCWNDDFTEHANANGNPVQERLVRCSHPKEG
jgi:hypothetical protein